MRYNIPMINPFRDFIGISTIVTLIFLVIQAMHRDGMIRLSIKPHRLRDLFFLDKKAISQLE